jgi:hypothetical protein
MIIRALPLIVLLALVPYACEASIAMPSAPVPSATELPLDAVRLLDGPFKHAQDLDADYLLRLEPDRLLAPYRLRAGLPAKAEGYGGWDHDGEILTGHMLGHYLSACSAMRQATGDQRFAQRVAYILDELEVVQRAQGDGYLGTMVGGKEGLLKLARGEIKAEKYRLNGVWAPFYTIHKLFAGLRDAYRLIGDRRALTLATGFAGWIEGILAPLSEAQMQTVLDAEFGGMVEALADLALDTGDARWLALARRFDHHLVTMPLRSLQDSLAGRHANTQLPKVIGMARLFSLVGDQADLAGATFAWEAVALQRSFATGGHGHNEHFGDHGAALEVDGRTAETCGVYNMLKLSRMLFSCQADARYADFQERALVNHVLASQHHDDGRMCYMVPVGHGVEHEYNDLFKDFTCCIGTGSELHATYGLAIYAQAPGRLYVNQFIASTATWSAAGMRLRQETAFPAGTVTTLHLGCAAPVATTLSIRRPLWAGDGFAVTVNGEAVALPGPASRYVDLTRTWNDGDMVVVRLPRTLHTEPVPGNAGRIAVLDGPVVLAGVLDQSSDRGAPPVLITGGRPVETWLEPIASSPGSFRTKGVGHEREVVLKPFNELDGLPYTIYWDVLAPEAWSARMVGITARRERERAYDALAVTKVIGGDPASERDLRLTSEDSSIGRLDGFSYRDGRWFSYVVPTKGETGLSLAVTYSGDDKGRTFEILVEGARIGNQTLDQNAPGRFITVEYPVPAALLAGKTEVTVRFQTLQPQGTAGGVYIVRLLRPGPRPAAER